MRELEQAGELARGLGIEFDRIVPLRSTNNTVGWLAPSDVVVKVGRDAERSSREVAIARALAEQGAPIVGPSDAVVARAHPIDQQCVATFWTYVSQTEGTELSAGEIAESLHGVHTSLGELGGEFELPNCTVGIQHAIDALDDAGFAPQLRVGERALLRVALAEGAAGLVSTADCVIHGAPHRFNILAVAGRVCFIDFETVCRGPIEWDLAHLEPAVASLYPGAVDDGLLARCRVAVGAVTATWCWGGLDRGSDMHDHAEHHLSVVRASVEGSARKRGESDR